MMAVKRKPKAKPFLRPWPGIPTSHVTAPVISATFPTGTGTVVAPTSSTAGPGLQIPSGWSGNQQQWNQLSPAQQQQVIQATKSPFDPSGWVGALIPYLKIAAGGLVVIVSGLALVYVAGRNVPGGSGAVGAVKTVAKGPAGVAKAAVRSASPRRREARQEARFYRTAYENTAEAKAGRSGARSTKVLPRRTGLGASRGPRSR